MEREMERESEREREREREREPAFSPLRRPGIEAPSTKGEPSKASEPRRINSARRAKDEMRAVVHSRSREVLGEKGGPIALLTFRLPLIPIYRCDGCTGGSRVCR